MRDLAVIALLATAMLGAFVVPRMRTRAEKDTLVENEYTGIGWSSTLWKLSLISNFSPYRLTLYGDFLVVATLFRQKISYIDIAALDVRRTGRVSIILKNGDSVTLFLPGRKIDIAKEFSKKNISITEL